MRTKATLAACIVLAGVGIACSSGGDDTEGPGAQGAAADVTGGKKRSIVMEVTGPAKADVTYGLNADQSQASGAKLPWKKTLSTSEAFTVAVVSAQNSGNGTIKCKITIDGKVAKENESQGQYSVVTCTADKI